MLLDAVLDETPAVTSELKSGDHVWTVGCVTALLAIHASKRAANDAGEGEIVLPGPKAPIELQRGFGR
jgi:hypothetical protein